MKKAKLTLGLVTALTAITALSACDVTPLDGVVLSYTDAQGKRVDYTAEELFGSYQTTTGAASTDFSKIQEVLIRKYYLNDQNYDQLVKEANNAVDGIKQTAEKNADNNGTTYQEEFESLLNSEGVDNIDELYEKKLYEVEKEKFESDYYATAKLEKMRDAGFNGGDVFPESTTGLGKAYGGYLVQRMPYHVSHILLQISGASETEATSIQITESESRSLGSLVQDLAKQKPGEITSESSNTTLNMLAKTTSYSADSGSASNYGDLGIMDKATSFVQGFQYGVYSFDAIYNKETNAYATDELKGSLLWSDDATYYNKNGVETSLDNAFTSIGQIPYGVAVALANEKVYQNKLAVGYQVNNNSATFFPRNVLFNKYFNTHKICVITPNRVAYNDYLEGTSTAGLTVTGTSYSKANELATWNGVKDASYAKLPGFGYNTQSILPGVKDANGDATNVLTTEKGQIILAVRGDSSSAGIHFIAIERSALSGYGLKTTAPVLNSNNEVVTEGTIAERTEAEYTASKDTADVTSLSDYYTLHNPLTDSAYPTYNNGSWKRTLVYNHERSSKQADYDNTIKTIKDNVKGYNSNIDTYIFQELLEKNNGATITFNETNPNVKKIKDLLTSWSTSKRVKSAADSQKSLDDSWTKYAEFLVSEEEKRELLDNGHQNLISETCAIGYTSDNAKPGQLGGEWQIGGACYAK